MKQFVKKVFSVLTAGVMMCSSQLFQQVTVTEAASSYKLTAITSDSQQENVVEVSDADSLKEQIKHTGKIKLADDILVKGLEISEGITIELDLNGYMLQCSSGHVIINNGTLTITDSQSGGKISNGYTNDKGGGIYNTGTLNLLGGSICNNTSYHGGSGVYNSESGFLLIDGAEITGNKIKDLSWTDSWEDYPHEEYIYVPHDDGSGIWNDGTMKFVSGEISNNTAGNGSGILNQGTLIMDGGIISKNKSYNYNSSVIVNLGTFVMNGGEITDHFGRYSGSEDGSMWETLTQIIENIGTIELNGGKIYNNYHSIDEDGYSDYPAESSSVLLNIQGTVKIGDDKVVIAGKESDGSDKQVISASSRDPFISLINEYGYIEVTDTAPTDLPVITVTTFMTTTTTTTTTTTATTTTTTPKVTTTTKATTTTTKTTTTTAKKTTTTTVTTTTTTTKTGDVTCDGTVDVSDAVLLARFLAEDTEAEIIEQGKKNADCNKSGKPDSEDVTMILKAIARLITL